MNKKNKITLANDPDFSNDVSSASTKVSDI